MISPTVQVWSAIPTWTRVVKSPATRSPKSSFLIASTNVFNVEHKCF